MDTPSSPIPGSCGARRAQGGAGRRPADAGGPAVNSIIGTFCGLFGNGTHGHQFTHGIADDILRDLGAKEQQLYFRHGPHTTIIYYDEVALACWIEAAIRKAGITIVLGAMLRRVQVEGRRVRGIELATRYGDVHVGSDRICRSER